MLSKIIGSATGNFDKTTMAEIFMCMIYVVIGAIISVLTKTNTSALAIITGILILINSGVTIFSFFKCDDINFYDSNLVYGILLAIIGLVAFFAKSFLAIIVGIFLIVLCIKNVSYTLELFKCRESSWILTLVVGLIYATIGILLFFTSSEKINNVISISFIGYAIINVSNISLLRKRSSNFVR